MTITYLPFLGFTVSTTGGLGSFINGTTSRSSSASKVTQEYINTLKRTRATFDVKNGKQIVAVYKTDY